MKTGSSRINESKDGNRKHDKTTKNGEVEMKKILLISLTVFLAMACSAQAAKKFPSRNITNVVVWGAGGGTDTCNRIISAEMAPFLGVNVRRASRLPKKGGSVSRS